MSKEIGISRIRRDGQTLASVDQRRHPENPAWLDASHLRMDYALTTGTPDLLVKLALGKASWTCSRSTVIPCRELQKIEETFPLTSDSGSYSWKQRGIPKWDLKHYLEAFVLGQGLGFQGDRLVSSKTTVVPAVTAEPSRLHG